MKSIRRSAVLALVTITAIGSLSSTALAAYQPVSNGSANESQIVARAEQTEWRHRIYGGEKQKRLWSITYQKWLTEWMPV